MPARKANELTDLIKKLRTIRRQHEVALAEIENTFKSFGLEHLLDGGGRKRGAAASTTATASKKGGKVPGKRGRPAKNATPAATPGKRGPKPKAGAAKKTGRKPGRPPKAAKKTRATYAQTGDEFIVSFIAKKGSATTSEIRQTWTKAGRKGKPENNLTGLVKSGKILRNATPGQAGSTYTVPGGSNTSSAS